MSAAFEAHEQALILEVELFENWDRLVVKHDKRWLSIKVHRVKSGF